MEKFTFELFVDYVSGDYERYTHTGLSLDDARECFFESLHHVEVTRSHVFSEETGEVLAHMTADASGMSVWFARP